MPKIFSVRRMPNFFENFPVVLTDKDDIVRADISFWRSESKFSFGETGVTVSFLGGVLDGQTFTDPFSVKKFAHLACGDPLFKEVNRRQSPP